jgi:hypothetical protein
MPRRRIRFELLEKFTQSSSAIIIQSLRLTQVQLHGAWRSDNLRAPERPGGQERQAVLRDPGSFPMAEQSAGRQKDLHGGPVNEGGGVQHQAI